MTFAEQIKAAVDRTNAEFAKVTEFELREAQTDLLEFYADRMNSATTKNHTVSPSGKLRSLPNKTDKLYVLYGNLVRALQPKQRGNIGIIDKGSQRVTLTIGIDLSVVPYARIHEYGGSTGRGGRSKIPARPFFFPAIEQYAKERYNERIARILDRVKTAWDRA